MKSLPPPSDAKAVARVAAGFAATYDLQGVRRLWVRPFEEGYEICCQVKPGNQDSTRDEVEALATEIAAQLEFGTPVNVTFISDQPNDSAAIAINIPT